MKYFVICMVVGNKEKYVLTENDIEEGGFLDPEYDNFGIDTKEEAEATMKILEKYAEEQGYDNMRFYIEDFDIEEEEEEE